ncbi:MAG: hypothetical protein AVDCRST_MAG17-2142, partial [uncultured Solirubrobacterales bacterium]
AAGPSPVDPGARRSARPPRRGDGGLDGGARRGPALAGDRPRRPAGPARRRAPIPHPRRGRPACRSL